jgi:hypothetical protein
MRLCTVTPILCVLLALITAATSASHAEERRPGGSGLFALSLEEALEIRVDVSPGEKIEKPGTYVLNRHELLRLHGHHKPSLHLTGTEITQKAVPLLINGEYFGDFATLAQALRYARELRAELSLLEVYSGDRARWWSHGDSTLVVNIITTTGSSRSTGHSTDAEARK